MKNKYLFVLVLLVCLAAASLGLTGLYVSNQEKKEETQELTVVTSFYPMYVAAENVIGDCQGVTLQNLSEPQTGCLHDYQLTPEDMKLLSTADVFVVNGGGIEGFLAEVAGEYPDLTIVDACEGVELLDDNAHAWMDPELYTEQVTNIADGLAKADPSHREIYKENSREYGARIHSLEHEFQDLRTVMEGEPVIIFHEAYAYVAHALGMEVVGVLDLDEERQTSAGEVAELLDLVKQQDVTYIFAERLYGEPMGDAIEAESEVQVLYLSPLNRGTYDPNDYLTGMEENLKILRDAFAGAPKSREGGV